MPSDDIKRREAEWLALDKAIEEYLDGYTMEGEDEHGSDASYTPTEGDQNMLRDVIAGLLSDEEVMAALANVYPIYSRFGRTTPLPEENA